MDGNSPDSGHVQPSDITAKAPEFELFLALLIVTEAERLVQVPSHLTATEVELLVQFPSLLTARGRNTGPVSFPALRQQRRTTDSFSFPPDSNGTEFLVQFRSRLTTMEPELPVQFPSHPTATALEL